MASPGCGLSMSTTRHAADRSQCEGTDGWYAGHSQEISILKSISYDRNIVQFYGAVLSGSEPMLVLEYMEVRAPSSASPHALVALRSSYANWPAL